ncbi:MAG: glycosyltransferase family 9 protein [Armatimonadetes bacterium]|nr:glycosyltransferase family 9 protein [Armatimonadota bacterium]
MSRESDPEEELRNLFEEETPAEGRPEKILLVRLSAIGDIIHTLPSAVAIRRALPDSELHWVVQENFADLLRGHRAIHELIEVPRRPSLRDLVALRERLRAERYTTALDMQGLFKSARIVWLSGAKRKLGFHWQREFSWLFSRGVKPREEGMHVIEQYLAVADKLFHVKPPNDRRQTPVEFDLEPQPDALASSKAKLDALSLHGRSLAINLGAGKPEKRWPVSHYARLIPMLRDEGWAPFVIGGPGDTETYDELCAQMDVPPPSLVGRTSLAELVALLSCANAHVAGDTGSLHIAVALGKPVVAIMGPTDPARTGPFGRRDSALYQGPDGLPAIEPEEVVRKLRRV